MSNAPHSKMSSEDLPIPRPLKSAESSKKDQILIDEASLESFPASDPPFWTPTHAGSPTTEPVKTETPRELRSRLRADVEALALASETGTTADVVTRALLDAGRHVMRIPVASLEHMPDLGTLEAEIRGTHDNDQLVIGANYGSNPSAVAALLGLARVLTGRHFARTVRLVAYSAGSLGSEGYAARLREQGVVLHAMFDLGSVGFLTNRNEPLGRVPRLSRIVPRWRGTFAAFVGEPQSRPLFAEAAAAFAKGTNLDVRVHVLPAFMPLLGMSDHRSFAREGFPAGLVTDTGPLRNLRQPKPSELSALVNYDAMCDLVFGLAAVVVRLAGEASS